MSVVFFCAADNIDAFNLTCECISENLQFNRSGTGNNDKPKRYSGLKLFGQFDGGLCRDDGIVQNELDVALK